MKRVQIIMTALFVLAACPLILRAYEWPVDTPKYASLTGMDKPSFVFESGVVFSDASMVRTAAAGKLLIRMDTANGHRNFPSSLGNTVIFIDETGLQTVYGNLESTVHLRDRTQTDARSPLGHTGNTAWEKAGSLPFQMIDTVNKVYINPQFLLPAIQDTTDPAILSVMLKAKNGITIPLDTVTEIQQGEYELYARIVDRHEKNGIPLSPFYITVEINGVKVTEIPFEVLQGTKGQLVLGNTGFTAAQLYQANDRLYLGTVNLVRGILKLEIFARDINENERTVLFEKVIQ